MGASAPNVNFENGFVECDYVEPNCWSCCCIDAFVVHHCSDAVTRSRFSWSLFTLCHGQLERKQRTVRCEMAIDILLQFCHGHWFLFIFHINHWNLQVIECRPEWRPYYAKTLKLMTSVCVLPQNKSIDAQTIGCIIFGTLFGCSVWHYVVFDDIRCSDYDNIGLYQLVQWHDTTISIVCFRMRTTGSKSKCILLINLVLFSYFCFA